MEIYTNNLTNGFFFSAAGNETADDIIRSALFLHKNFVQVTPEDVIQLVSVAAPHQKGQDELMQSAAQHMVLTLYRNQLKIGRAHV